MLDAAEVGSDEAHGALMIPKAGSTDCRRLAQRALPLSLSGLACMAMRRGWLIRCEGPGLAAGGTHGAEGRFVGAQEACHSVGVGMRLSRRATRADITPACAFDPARRQNAVATGEDQERQHQPGIGLPSPFGRALIGKVPSGTRPTAPHAEVPRVLLGQPSFRFGHSGNAWPQSDKPQARREADRRAAQVRSASGHGRLGRTEFRSPPDPNPACPKIPRCLLRITLVSGWALVCYQCLWRGA